MRSDRHRAWTGPRSSSTTSPRTARSAGPGRRSPEYSSRQDHRAGCDPGPAVGPDRPVGVRPRDRRNRSASSVGGRQWPSGPRCSENGALTAPGTCPARGSTGSVSPRYRAGALASSSVPVRARSAASVGVEQRHAGGCPGREQARRDHRVSGPGVVAVTGMALGDPGGPPPVEYHYLPGRRIPSHRSNHHARAATEPSASS